MEHKGAVEGSLPPIRQVEEGSSDQTVKDSSPFEIREVRVGSKGAGENIAVGFEQGSSAACISSSHGCEGSHPYSRESHLRVRVFFNRVFFIEIDRDGLHRISTSSIN